MNGRALSAILMLLVLLAVGLVSTPALSGEHPWDSDDAGNEKTVVDKGLTASVADTIDVETGDDITNDDNAEDDAASAGGSSIDFASLVYGFFSIVSVGL